MTEPPTDAILRDQYEDWRLLGSGALGETWHARDRLTDREVVVKLRPHTDAAQRMAMREADVLKGLASAHVQKLSMVIARTGDGMALVYDFVPGRSLREVLETDGPLTERAAVDMAADVLRGLADLHRAGAIHRDVSPENIVLSPERGAVLIDFNALGALTERNRLGQTTIVGEFAGKGFYMAPEQLAAAPQSAATDIWAVGAVLYEALTGRRLRQERDFTGLIRASMTEPDVEAAPPAFRSVLAQLLAVDPGGRPDAGEAARLIFAAADPFDERAAGTIFNEKDTGGSQKLILPNRPPRIQIVHPQPFPEAPAPGPAAAKRGRAGGGWLLTLAAVLLCGVIAIVWFVAGQSNARDIGELKQAILDPAVQTGLLLLAAGPVLAVGGAALAAYVRQRAARTEDALPFRAIDLIGAPDAHARLSHTIVVGIDAYRDAAGGQAEDLLTVTMVALAHEYANADNSDARIAALKMLNDLHAQVARRLRPWWLDYEKLVARGVALTTLVAGAVAAVEGVRRLLWEAGV